MRKNSKTGRTSSGKNLLRVFAAAFILLGPTVLAGAAKGWGLYGLFVLTAAVFAVRLIETKKIHISVNILLGAACLLYALFALIWAENRYDHIRLIFIILTVCLSGLLTADYLSLEKGNGIENRLAWMVTASAFICGAWNIIAWGLLRKFSLSEAFSAGLGSGDLVGAYMLAGLWCWRRVFSRKKKMKWQPFVVAAPMVFVLIMSRSLLTGLFAGIFALLCFFRRGKTLPGIVSGAVAALSAAGLVIWGGTGGARPFADAVVCGLRNIGGLGGGGFLLHQFELQSAYYSVDRLGLGADFISSLGLAGLLSFGALVGWEAYLAFARGSVFSAFGVFVCVFAFFVPAGGSIAALVLMAGALIYGEWRRGKTMSVSIKAGRIAALSVLAAAAVYGCFLGAGDMIKAFGVKNGSGEGLALAARLNPLDGESCFLAARAYHEAFNNGGSRKDMAYAEYYIELAIERSGETALYRAEYASIKADDGEMADAVRMDDQAMELAPLWDDCRVQAAEHLYSMAETAQKGSLAAQNYHRRILQLGDQVEDMEKKKIINDYADKAQPYTRIELYDSDETGEEEE